MPTDDELRKLEAMCREMLTLAEKATPDDAIEGEDAIGELLDILLSATAAPWSLKLRALDDDDVLVGPDGQHLRKIDAKLMMTARNFLEPLLTLAQIGVKARTALPTLARALLSRLEAEAWQPIETGPRDGTRVLTYSPKAKAHGYSAVDVNYWVGDWQTTNEKSWPPTHWKPLPTPPERRHG